MADDRETVLDRLLNPLVGLGAFARFSGSACRWMVTSRPAGRELLRQMYEIGVRSVPVIVITGAFIGMVLAAEAFGQFEDLGIKNLIGGVVNISMVKELGPVLAALMLAGRVGSAMAAELGTMRVTEQIDALQAMGADPVHHLVVPRVLACVLYIPLLTILADFCGVVGGYVLSVEVMGADYHYYWYYSRDYIETWDILCGVWKALFFGAAISLISCYKGFNCRPGAEGVGRAATEAFVSSFIAILMLDFVLVILLQVLYRLLISGTL